MYYKVHNEINYSVHMQFYKKIIYLKERSLSIEQRGAEDFGKICGKISGPNVLASGNPIPQQNSQHKIRAPTK